MTATVRAMKRIGTSSNYMRVTPANEHLLNDNRMIEVICVETDAGLAEESSTTQDFLASKDLGRIVSEIRTLDDKRHSLLTHAASLIGGHEALASAGIEVPTQTMHDAPLARHNENENKQAQKAKNQKAQARQVRKNRRNKKATPPLPADGPVTGVQALPPIVRDDNGDPVTTPQQTIHTDDDALEDI